LESLETFGPEVADICAAANYEPDADQEQALNAIFAFHPGGKVAALEGAVVACRQNIKTALFKMCALGWLYVTEDRLVTWSAHEFDTAQEAHRELAELIDGCAPLRRRLKAVHYGAADKSIELNTGQRVKFKARTKTGSRGLSGDKMVLDEGFALEASHIGSLFPTMSARPNPQALYGSSAGHVSSAVLRSIRDRGRRGDPSLIYIEYTDDLDGECQEPACDHAITRRGCLLDDEDRWYRANPALGRRITVEYVRAERRAMPPAEFARERLGWWDEDPDEGRALSPEQWAGCLEYGSEIVGTPVYALEVAEDRQWACVAVAGKNSKGLVHVEYGAYQRQTGWIVNFFKDLASRRKVKVVIQPSSPAGSLISELEALKIEVLRVNPQDYAQACGGFYDSVTDRRDLRHNGQPALEVSVSAAQKKRSGESWVWDRRNAQTDISPLVAVTLAHWATRRKSGGSRFVAF
jgi:phage terminase large subunit-like protein